MIKPVIMAGGSGTRLWPFSRALRPKQFLPLHNGNSMLQNTLKRLDGLKTDSSLIICNQEHRFLVAEQLQEINRLGSIILEPVGRNTAPAIGLAALSFPEDEDPLLLVLAADHLIKDQAAFTKTIKSAIPLAESGKLITFGILPNEPNTGYGYIKKGESCDSGFIVDAFIEKPSLERANEYLKSDDYFWNSGMFLFRASRYLEELEKHRPDIYEVCQLSMEDATTDYDFLRIKEEIFNKCPSDSIDYAVMEKTDDAVVFPMDAGWSDIGSWSSLFDISNKDDKSNTTHGDVILHESYNSYIRTEDKLVAAVGIDDLIIISTKDALLVAHKDRAQDVQIIVKKLKSESRSECEHNREVYRPWGKYDSIDIGDGYQVKRITVKPGAKLSLQKHHHRAEHWVVVSGTAKVTNGEKTFILSKNESTYIPVGVIHALENPGEALLEMIEVQSGSYLGEDDIVRFEDIYGRLSD